jgi:phosphopantothenoylcysteine decarboxylase/phosphopantothenate--cysteine ligase
LDRLIWEPTPPAPSSLGDREVPLEGSHLAGKRIALLVSGSIAAYRAPDVARALRRQGATVVAFASSQALRYVSEEALAWATDGPVVTRLTAAAEHLSDAAPFSAYLLAPGTYNTINKFRQGVADGVLTATLASALGRLERGLTAIAIAPTLHGSLHNQIFTESIKTLQSWGVSVIAPRPGYGKHNLPDPTAIAAAVCRLTSTSPLRDVRVLVTGGPTPVAIDGIRRLTNRFTGQLGIAIAAELYRRGAAVTLVHGRSPVTPPEWLPHHIAETYDEYRDRVLEILGDRPHRFGIFSAAVADYRPATVAPGKVPSGRESWALDLIPTEKVIDLVGDRFPQVDRLTFKFQAGIDHEALMAIARDRLDRGHRAVIANRAEEVGPHGEQVAYLVAPDQPPRRAVGKPAIAQLIADHLETLTHLCD